MRLAAELTRRELSLHLGIPAASVRVIISLFKPFGSLENHWTARTIDFSWSQSRRSTSRRYAADGECMAQIEVTGSGQWLYREIRGTNP